MPSEKPAIETDDVFRLLASKRRRFVLFVLDARSRVTVSGLAELVAAQEFDQPRYALSDEQVKRVYVSLYQVHLPKLEDHGVIRQVDSGEYVLGESADEVWWYLENGPRSSEFQERLNR